MLQVGDLQNFNNYRQYAKASEIVGILNNANFPYAMALGNHDTAAVGEWSGSAAPGKVFENVRDTTLYNTYYPANRFTMLRGVFEYGRIDSGWHTFSAGDLDWLVLNLELWPRTEVIEWAKAVITAHPHHNVIVLTHAYMNSDGSIQQNNGGYGANSPQFLFTEAIKPFANVRLVFCGHVGHANNHRVDTGTNGNPIHSFLQDETSGKGMTRFITIGTKAGTITSKMYSHVDGAYLTGASAFTVNGISWVQRAAAGKPIVTPATPARRTVKIGQTATFTVTASGSPTPTYQWQRNGANIAGATAASYTTPAAVAADNGASYRCVVSSSAGSSTSNAAILTLAVAPGITLQPVSQTVALGSSVTFLVNVSGKPRPTFQWQRNGVDIPHATAISYIIAKTVAADHGATFRCVVTNIAGSATSANATLSISGVSTVAPTITTQPMNKTVTVGQTATFTVAATGTPAPTYQWQKNSTNISGATSASYTTSATVAGDNGATFRCVVTNSVGSKTSNSATLTVNVAPTITTQPVNKTVTVGQTATFTVAATGTPAPTYQWQKNSANISGATSASYTTPATASGDNGATFRCVVTNSAGSKTSNNATLTVNVAPAITTQPASQTRAVGQTATFTVAASGRPTPTFQWQKNGTNISGATSASYTTLALTAADHGAQYRCVATNSVGTATSSAATITMSGIGWQGSYYDNKDFTGTKVERADLAVDFDWGASAPMGSMGADTFSVRWRGMVKPAYSQTYTFTATCDDGVRVWVGGKKVIDRWTDSGATATSGLVNLTAGTPVLVVMEYYENAGSAVAKLSWQSASQAAQTIPHTAVVPATGEDLPGGWTAQDVGAVGLAGGTTESGGAWTLTGSGSDIWNSADEFRFVWQQVSGDVRITAQVTSLTTTNPWSKAGVMVRESLATGARHAFTCVTPGNGVAFQRRLTANAASRHTAGIYKQAPYWVRLERIGNVLIGSSSPDGTVWTEIRRETITLGTTVYVGLALTSHDDAALATAGFRNVQITAAGSAVN